MNDRTAAESTRPSVKALEVRVLAEYEAVLGKTFTTCELYGYFGSDSIDLRQQDGWLDPCWNVELAEAHPEVSTDVRGLYVFGTSHSVIEGTEEPHRLLPGHPAGTCKSCRDALNVDDHDTLVDQTGGDVCPVASLDPRENRPHELA